MSLQNKIISGGIKSALKQKSLVSKILNIIGLLLFSLFGFVGLILLFDGSEEMMMRLTTTLLVTYPSIFIVYNKILKKISIGESIKCHFLLWIYFPDSRIIWNK